MENEFCSCGRAISVIQRHIAARVNSELKNEGITYGYALFIMYIGKESGCSQTDLCNYLMIDKTTTAKNIKKLESMGLIRREKDEEDHRFYHVTLTEKGELAREKVCQVLQETAKVLKRRMTAKQESQAEELLKMMEENICYDVCGKDH